MAVITHLIDFIFNLNTYLSIFVNNYGGWVYFVLFLIVFCETGLVVTAILPGDSLLFAAGAVAAGGGGLNVYFLMILLITAAFLGNVVNYWVGDQLGHLLFKNEQSLFFKKSYLEKTHAFYEKYGGKTIVIARFIPIIRTFAPFVAGMGSMHYFKFITFNFLGAFFWVVLIVWGSYLFGNIPIVKDNFSLVILAIIVISILPPFIEYARVSLAKRLK